MKKLKLKFMFLLVVLMSSTLFYCKKTETPADPNEDLVVKREIVISALNAFNKDSISQFDAKITTPTTTMSKTSTGNRLVVTNLVAGTYKIIISKSGFTTSEEQEITIVLPTDPKASLIIPTGVLLSKTATPVAVTGATGATIAVKEDAANASSAPVAAAQVQPGTTFTLADGTKPASVSISVTNIPVNTDVAPVTIINGVSTKVVTGPVEVIGDKIPSTKLDLQPEGLVLSQPMIISVNLSDRYPASMSVAEKTARQAGLRMNYERKDGTFEVVTPDNFSADRNTVYYKISHFSQWNEVNEFVKITKSSTTGLSPLQIANGICGRVFSNTFSYSQTLTSKFSWLLAGSETPITYASTTKVDAEAKSGFSAQYRYNCVTESYTLTDLTPGFGSSITFTKPVNGVTTLIWSACHNQ